MLETISPLYRSVKFIPSGEINTQNLERYLNLSFVYTSGGSWFVKKE